MVSSHQSRLKLGRAALLGVAALGAASIYYYSSIEYSYDDEQLYRRQLSKTLANGGCEVTRASPSATPIIPAWQASFPGSGARMTLFLVQALTGIQTNNDYNSNQRGFDNVVTVKTHYPINFPENFKELEKEYGFDKALLVVRHPKDAIPSFFNFQWEHGHGLPNHSTRGPQSDWLKFRDSALGCNVECNFRHYEEFIKIWMTKYKEDRSKLHIVSYEDMTNTQTGPRTALSIAKFLGQTEGVNPIANENVPCVWETVINYKNHVEDGTRNLKRRMTDAGKTHVDPRSKRTGPKIRPYTQKMLDDMLAMLQRLKARYGDDEELGRILDEYIQSTSKTPAEEGLEEGSKE